MVSSYDIKNLANEIGIPASIFRISEHLSLLEAAVNLGMEDMKRKTGEIDICRDLLSRSETAVTKELYDFSYTDKNATAVEFVNRTDLDTENGTFIDTVRHIIKLKELYLESYSSEIEDSSLEYVEGIDECSGNDSNICVDIIAAIRVYGVPAVAIYFEGQLVELRIKFCGNAGIDIRKDRVNCLPLSVKNTGKSFTYVYGTLALSDKQIDRMNFNYSALLKKYIGHIKDEDSNEKFMFFAENVYTSCGNISVERSVEYGLYGRKHTKYSEILKWLDNNCFAVCGNIKIIGVNMDNVEYWTNAVNIAGSIDLGCADGYIIKAIYETVDDFDKYRANIEINSYCSSDRGCLLAPYGGSSDTLVKIVGAYIETEGADVRIFVKVIGVDSKSKIPVESIEVSLDELYMLHEGMEITIDYRFGNWRLSIIED